MIDVFAGPKRRHFYRAGAFCAVLVCLGLQAQHAAAQIPDFAQGRDISWYFDREDGDNFLPPAGGPGPVMSPPEYPYRPNASGDSAAGDPTYRIADLSNPILQSWAVEQMQRSNEEVLAGKVPFTARQRCYPPGVPAWNVFRRVGAGPMIFFLQTPDEVVMIWRGDNQVRHIYLNVPHSENPNPTWHGESIGHYEGDTLVVDTIALLDHPLSFVDNYRTPHTDRLHVVERFRLVENNDTIEVQIYVEDPGAFTTPWRAEQIMSPTDAGPLIEWRCAEGNPDYFNLYGEPVPWDDTPDF